MGFPNNKDNNKKFVFNKGSYKSQCAYMLMLIRQKNPKDWVLLKQEFGDVSDDDSFAFFEKLVAIYKGQRGVTETAKKEPKKPGVVVPLKAKAEDTKKAPVKKKVTKKAPVKKKVTKKAPAKKKVTKKVPAKKKVTKKVPVKKKVTKKKATAKKKPVKKAVKKTNKKK